MAQLTIRFSDTVIAQIRAAAGERGFRSPTALVRYAVRCELAGDKNRIEQSIAASLDRVYGDLHEQHEVLTTLFAFCDALARAVLSMGARQMASTCRVIMESTICNWGARSISVGGPFQRMSTLFSRAAAMAPACTDCQNKCAWPLGMTAMRLRVSRLQAPRTRSKQANKPRQRKRE